MYEALVPFGASLGIGLLIGLERERNPAAKAGVRTFALVALLGTLAAMVGESTWMLPVGLAAVATISLAYLANVGFKLAVLVWFNRRLALRALWPLAASVAAGGMVFFLSGNA